MTLRRRTLVREINPHLICVLCSGYFIEAATIVECLHSFCRSCLVKYLEKNKFCPICDVQLYKNNPLLSVRCDSTLQQLVYKLIPGLYGREMLRRKKYYSELGGPGSDPDCSEFPVGDAYFSPEDSISLSLEFINKEESVEDETDKQGVHHRRYLQCPAAVTMSHLKKFLRMKYGLNHDQNVDIIYSDEVLNDDFSLMDVAYTFSWNRATPMRFQFRLLQKNHLFAAAGVERKKDGADSVKKNGSLEKAKKTENGLKRANEHSEGPEAKKLKIAEDKAKGELLKKEKEVRLKEEQEERLKKEKEKRLKEEQQKGLKEEQEKRLKEEQAKRLKEEHEKRLKKEQEKRLKEEQEKRLKEEQEKRLKEEHEKRLKKEKERLKRETEERLKTENEKRLKREEKLRKERQERRVKEKHEERLRKEKEERARKERKEKEKKQKSYVDIEKDIEEIDDNEDLHQITLDDNIEEMKEPINRKSEERRKEKKKNKKAKHHHYRHHSPPAATILHSSENDIMKLKIKLNDKKYVVEEKKENGFKEKKDEESDVANNNEIKTNEVSSKELAPMKRPPKLTPVAKVTSPKIQNGVKMPPSSITVSKITAAEKLKMEELKQNGEKRPSLEIMLVNAPKKEQEVKKVIRPPPQSIPLSRVRTVFGPKSSPPPLVPKNEEALDLSKRSPESQNLMSRNLMPPTLKIPAFNTKMPFQRAVKPVPNPTVRQIPNPSALIFRNHGRGLPPPGVPINSLRKMESMTKNIERVAAGLTVKAAVEAIKSSL